MRGDDRELPVFSGFLINGRPAVALREDGSKFIYDPGTGAEEFYDLKTDPEEKNSLVESGDQRVREFRKRTRDWMSRTSERYSPEPVQFDEETREKLKALGYVLSAATVRWPASCNAAVFPARTDG